MGDFLEMPVDLNFDFAIVDLGTATEVCFRIRFGIHGFGFIVVVIGLASIPSQV